MYALLAATAFALVNLFAYKLHHATENYRAKTLSFFGGIAAAYVFLDLLPNLLQAGEYLKQITGGSQLVAFYEDAIFLLVFVGFLIFFVLEHLAKQSRGRIQASTKQQFREVQGTKSLFVIHFAIFAFLNSILSFVLIFEFQAGFVGGLLYTFAVSLHLFIANDSMVEHYKRLQLKGGRYVAAVIPFIGWAISLLYPERLSEAYVLLALISGVILYDSVKNEVPSALKKQSLALFLAGAGIYTLLLLVHTLIT